MSIIGIPYHPAKRYALPHLFDWLDQQKDCEVLLRVDTGSYGRKGAIKEQLEFFRMLAIRKKARYLLIVEADTVPPVDVLQTLIAHKKDIVGALCRYRTTEAPICAWPKESITEGLCEVEGMGTGCVLLSRKAFSSFSFYDWDVPDHDYPMYDLLRQKGFKVFLDTNAVCRHYADAFTYY